MAASPKVSLKLLIDAKSQKVLFAEADKKAVDFLFHILTLPMATVIRLLTKQKMVGCLANLYDSIENLSETYLQKNQTKDVLLKPTIPLDSTTFSSTLFALPSNDQASGRNIYRCGTQGYQISHYNCYGDEAGTVCPGCKTVMTFKMQYVPPPSKSNMQERAVGEEVDVEEGGFVKGVVTYMVMDDLVVQPMSTISSIALLNKFNVKEVGALQEKVVDLGINEALNLLKTSLGSKAVLTTVFLKNTGK